MNQMSTTYRLGVDIGSTTVKVAVLDQENRILFSDYERHYANIQETLAKLLKKAVSQTGDILVIPVITGSGGPDTLLPSSYPLCTGGRSRCLLSSGLCAPD